MEKSEVFLPRKDAGPRFATTVLTMMQTEKLTAPTLPAMRGPVQMEYYASLLK
jgi:hypothetical protein